jgi:hypothetical protein
VGNDAWRLIAISLDARVNAMHTTNRYVFADCERMLGAA